MYGYTHRESEWIWWSMDGMSRKWSVSQSDRLTMTLMDVGQGCNAMQWNMQCGNREYGMWVSDWWSAMVKCTQCHHHWSKVLTEYESYNAYVIPRVWMWSDLSACVTFVWHLCDKELLALALMDWTGLQTNRQTDWQTDQQIRVADTHRHTPTDTHRHPLRQTDRQTDRHYITHIHIIHYIISYYILLTQSVLAQHTTHTHTCSVTHTDTHTHTHTPTVR